MILHKLGSFMHNSQLGPDPGSRLLCSHLLTCDQPVPDGSHFSDATFERFCQRVQDRNDALILRDVTPLLVPSAENLALHGLNERGCLAESLESVWDSSWPLTDECPQPDYSVGFSRGAFTAEQLEKLRPYIGDCSPGLQSHFMANYRIFFLFLACEVRCGNTGLLPAERQNAHCMTLAVRGVVGLFRLVGREQELHRRIVAFSITHNNRFVTLHGYYAEIDGEETKFYQHTIREFVFTNDDEKWTAYRFTRNIYLEWMPQHFRNLCSAIDLLPIESVSSKSSQGDLSDPVSSAAYPVTGE